MELQGRLCAFSRPNLLPVLRNAKPSATKALVAAIETEGCGLSKQRGARPGQGKRGGFRMLIAFRPDRAVFLFGFAKNERDNIEDKELTTLREIVASWFAADDDKIARALTD